VPEISLIFEKSTVKNPNEENVDSSPAKSARQISDATMEVNSTSPISLKANSYAAWKEQNRFKKINSTNISTHVSPLCKNVYSYHYAMPSDLQDTSVQKQQERTKINDMQERLQNANKNDKIYEKSVKFICCNTGDFQDLKNQTDLSSSDKRPLSSDSLQRATLSVIDNTMGMSNNTVPDKTLKKPQHFQIPPIDYQQFHVPNYSSYSIDNNETIKTLLQIVNSQNEQIKNLQLQVDRLIRMQEENFRNKSTCLCSQPLANQVFKYPMNCYDSAVASSFAQSQSQGIKKNIASQNTSVIEKQDLENFGENDKLETSLLEQQSKKAFMEQKVSIGVMTSFEFTVQNSPFLIDSEICEKKEVHREGNNISKTNTVNVHDTTDSINRYKNTFTRKPGAALENIVEDSESYLSSSQQQSSNFNAGSSIKESLKMYQHPSIDLNQREIHEGVYTGKDSNVEEGMSNAKKTSITFTNIDCSPIGSTNCSKAHVEHDYVTTNGRKSSCKTNINEHLHNVRLPDYCRNRNKEYGANIRQIKDVGDSMILSGGDLKILERPPPTPEPSIHVEMQEYTSDDESDKLRHTSKIGWTFYDNVLGQVNEILQNSGVTNNKNLNYAKAAHNVEQENGTEARTALNTVKAATLDQLRRLGISLTENNEQKESSDNKTYVSLYSF